jgi:hypothetical protein
MLGAQRSVTSVPPPATRTLVLYQLSRKLLI